MHLRLDTLFFAGILAEVKPCADFQFLQKFRILYTQCFVSSDEMIAVLIVGVLIGCCVGTPLSAVWLSPIAPVAPLGQYQVQDGLGGYHYAYTGPHHSKVETRLGGTTQGGYSYIDANGILQTVAYTADALNGFRVQASNLPQQPKDDLIPVKDTAEVSAAKEMHLEEIRKAELIANQAENAWQTPQRVTSDPLTVNQGFIDYSNPAKLEADNKLDDDKSALEKGQHPFLLSKNEADKISQDVPSLSANLVAPSAVPSNYIYQKEGQIQGYAPLPNFHHYVYPVAPYRLMHSSLRHTQDSLGQYDYTYAGDTSAKTESRSIDGTTRGAYSYIDANGLLQQVHYIADHNGFRVAATNLPEAK